MVDNEMTVSAILFLLIKKQQLLSLLEEILFAFVCCCHSYNCALVELFNPLTAMYG